MVTGAEQTCYRIQPNNINSRPRRRNAQMAGHSAANPDPQEH